MTCTVFETTGLIDVRAFTTMGLSAKPLSSNPIGFFGTGLKYAVAVSMRLGAKLHVWIGKDRYVFEQRPAEFRGREFRQLRMRRERWSLTRATYVELPYTTEYGRNWKMWQVFRELESNTRDEGGTTRLDTVPIDNIVGTDGVTRIAIEHPDMERAWEDRNSVFLPQAMRAIEDQVSVQVLPPSSSSLYWRGLKVYETGKPCLRTYNFLGHLELTEDRTLAAEFYAKYMLARMLVTECHDENLIEAVLTVNDKHWEHGLDLSAAGEPSEAFHRVMLRHPRGISASVWGYYGRYDRRPAPANLDPLSVHPRPWRLEGEQVVDANGTALFDCPYGYQGRWIALAEVMLNRVNDSGTSDPYDEYEPASRLVSEQPMGWPVQVAESGDVEGGE